MTSNGMTGMVSESPNQPTPDIATRMAEEEPAVATSPDNEKSNDEWRVLASMRVLEGNTINFGVPARESMMSYVEEAHGEDSWQHKVLHFLHLKWVQNTCIILLIFDILIVFAELFILAEWPSCAAIEHHSIACCGDQSLISDKIAYDSNRYLADTDAPDDNIIGYCPTGTEYTGISKCNKSTLYYRINYIALWVCFSITIIILSIFFVELSLEMAALGPCVFWKQSFLAFDFIVVTMSLVMEITFKAKKDDLKTTFGMLIVLRLWRFVRIGHGVVEATTKLTHTYYSDLIEYAKRCETKLRSHNIDPPEKSDNVIEIMDDDHH